MRLKLLCCKVLCREVSEIIAKSDNYIDVTFIRQGLHNVPQQLKSTLQSEIDKIDSDSDICTCSSEEFQFDAILLGYGLCSNSVLGLKSKKYTIIMPRAHDCITLFLGSKEAYSDYFKNGDGGIYWYSPGWIDNVLMPGEQKEKRDYDVYTEKYDEDSAQFLVESQMESYKKYKMAGFINTCPPLYEKYSEITKNAAAFYGWEFTDFAGNMSLLQDFLNGKWDNERFLVIKPGQTFEASFDESIIKLTDA